MINSTYFTKISHSSGWKVIFEYTYAWSSLTIKAHSKKRFKTCYNLVEINMEVYLEDITKTNNNIFIYFLKYFKWFVLHPRTVLIRKLKII